MSREPRSPVDLRRRRLLAGLAAAPLASAAFPGALAAPLPEEPKEPTPAGKKDKAGPHRAEAEALLGLIQQRYGAYLEKDQLEEVRASIESQLDAGRQMARIALANADEPDFAFSPYRGGEE